MTQRSVINAANKNRLPGHIALIEADDINDACLRAVQEMRREPVNIAVWNGWVDQTSAASGERVHLLRRKNLIPTFYNEGTSCLDPMDVRGRFNMAARQPPDWLRNEFDLVRDRVDALVKALYEACPDSSVSLSVRNECALRLNHFIHVDRDNLFEDPDGLARSFFGQAVRALLIIDGSGTAVFENESVDFQRFPVAAAPGVNEYVVIDGIRKDNATIWHMARWSVAFLSGQYWPWQPVVHSVPVADHWWWRERRSLALARITP